MDPIATSFAVEDLLAQASWIRSLARRLVQDPSQADDVAQEALVAALEYTPATDRSLRPWLATVLRRRIAWLGRGERGRSAREAEVARHEALPSSAELAARAETQRRLVAEVMALEDPYRSLLLLRFYEGLTPAEIARRFGQSPGTVRGQLSRAVARLRHRLDANSDEAQLDWRVAFLPLFREPSYGSLPPFLSLQTLTAMHLVPKLLAGACVLAGAFLIYDRQAAEPQLAIAEVLAPPAVPGLASRAPGERSLPLVTDRSEAEEARTARREVTDTSEERATTTPSRSVIEGTLVIEELDGVSRPAEGFSLKLTHDEGAAEIVTTDGAGRFRSAGLHAQGGVRFDMIDHERLDRGLHLGRTVVMDLDETALSREFLPQTSLSLAVSARREFQLELGGPPDVVASIDQVQLTSGSLSEPEGMISDFLRLLAPLRRGSGSDDRQLWVRFAPLGMDTAGWWLRVVSADGLWVARARTPESTRFDAEPIRLDLVPAGRLEVSIPWLATVEPNEISVGFRPLERVSTAMAMTRMSTEGEQSVYARGGLAAGRYRLSAHAEGTPVASRDVELAEGQVERVTIELEYPSALYPLELRLGSDSGDYHGVLCFMARSEHSNRVFSSQPTQWSQDEDGRWSGTQDLGMLPAGEYTLEVLINRPLRAWDRSHRTFVVPGPPLEILCQDSGEKADLGLSIVDARSGSEVAGARCRIYFDKDSKGFVGRSGEPVQWKDIVLASKPRWIVQAAGYRDVAGDWSEFEWVEGTRRVQVVLEPTE